MKARAEFIVYLVGIALLGFFYGRVRLAIGSEPVFFVAAILYLVALRLAGKLVAKYIARGPKP